MRGADEAAFDEHAGDRDVADDDEARALDAPVIQLRVADHRRVRGAGERHVFRIADVAGAEMEVGDARPVGHHRRHAARREGVNFEAAGSGAAGVEVDADKDGVVELVGEFRAVIERNEPVVDARHVNFEAVLLQDLPRTARDIERVFLLPAPLPDRAGVVAPVAGIKDDGVDFLRVADAVGTYHRLDEFRQIHARNHQLPVVLGEGVAENELEVVDVKFRRAARTAQRALAAAEDRVVVVHAAHRTEAVEFGDIVERHVIAALVLEEHPVACAGRDENRGSRKKRKQTGAKGAHGRVEDAAARGGWQAVSDSESD